MAAGFSSIPRLRAWRLSRGLPRFETLAQSLGFLIAQRTTKRGGNRYAPMFANHVNISPQVASRVPSLHMFGRLADHGPTAGQRQIVHQTVRQIMRSQIGLHRKHSSSIGLLSPSAFLACPPQKQHERQDKDRPTDHRPTRGTGLSLKSIYLEHTTTSMRKLRLSPGGKRIIPGFSLISPSKPCGSAWPAHGSIHI